MSTVSLESFTNDLFQKYLEDDDITEIAINRNNGVWYENSKGWHFDKVELESDLIHRWCVSVASFQSDEISVSKPILGAVLPMNSERVQIVYPYAVKGRESISITIRKPSKKKISYDDYIKSGFFNQIQSEAIELSSNDIALCQYYEQKNFIEFIRASVKSHKNIIICGGTGSGKTTFMKSLVELIDPRERIITIEDVPEISFFKHENYVQLFYPSSAKQGDVVTSSLLLKSCLRMKPDRILLAELRGAETFDFLNIIMSGHDGGITSCHASSVKDTFKRLLAMASQHEAASTLGIEFLKSLLDSINVIVTIDKDYDYNRRINEIYFDKYKIYTERGKHEVI